jgi:beta-mannosidase
MEPTWYRKIYGQLPFVAESGIHSFPNEKSLRQQISAEEYSKSLSDIFSEEFVTNNPELHNHFTEFNPARIPRMMARASMINNIRGITLSDLCEATQIASCEFYQIMIQAMRENYPINCGILPWCFKRPWTTTAIQLVDGLGDPIAPYYYVKNAYSPLCVEIALKEITYAVGEVIESDIRLICDGTGEFAGLSVEYEIYSPRLMLVHHNSFRCDVTPRDYQKRFTGSPFILPDDYNDKYFFLRVFVKNSSKMLHQSVYWCKVLSLFENEDIRTKYRQAPQENIDFKLGPWLKPQISSLPKNKCTVTVLDKVVLFDETERRACVKIKVENHGNSPAFPIKLDVYEDKTLCYADDNYFFLPCGEHRELFLEIRIKDNSLSELTLELSAWNTEMQRVKITL